MKTKHIILIFFVLLMNNIYCQGYQIADTSKIWNTVWGGYGSFMIANCGGTKSHSFSGQTIINNEAYFNVFQATDSLLINWDQIGYIREDTTNKTVYYHSGDDNEGLIYDFDISIGDSVYIDNEYLGFTGALLKCDNIDTIEVQGTERKRFLFYSGNTTVYSDIWIEGIGSIYGLLYSGADAAGFVGGFTNLLCCKKNDSLIYYDSGFNTCYIDDFNPRITTEYIDTAYVGLNYEFQFQLSDTTEIDSIAWNGDLIPDNFDFDNTYGIISGIPQYVGSFHFLVTVRNIDIGYRTDYLASDIIVLEPVGNQSPSFKQEFVLFPNPCFTSLEIELTGLESGTYYLEIYNSSGKRIDTVIIKDSMYKYNSSRLKSGLYFFLFYDNKKNLINTERVQKI